MNNHGHTLIELLIAMAISLIITAGVSGFFKFQYGLFKTQTEEVEAIQTVRSVAHMLGREIILAGYGVPPGMLRITKALEDEIEFRTNLRDIRGKLRSTAYAGESILYLDIQTKAFKKNDRIILCKGITEGINQCGEYTVASRGGSNGLILQTPLREIYPAGSTVSRIDIISYRYNKSKKRLERKAGRGYWQPAGEGISDARFIYMDRDNHKTTELMNITRMDLSLTRSLRDGKIIKIRRSIKLRN